MGRERIQQALLQTLVNYQRCGVRWISNDRHLPAGYASAWQSFVMAESLDSSATDNEAAARLPHSTPEQLNGRDQIATKTTAPPAPPITAVRPPLAASQAAVAEPRDWQSTSLPDSQRLAVFHELAQQVSQCRQCAEICNFRKQAVFGVGPIRPTICFMGEAPGADEDRLGEPFVGKAGQLLTRIIGAMQLRREEVYILNSLKCRPPGNRTPSPVEIEHCRPFVESQLETLQPKYIVCLGAVAARSLLQLESPVGQLRGKFFAYRGAKVLVTYHPSYLLRNEAAKRLVWEDMQILMRELGIALPSKNT